MDRRMQAGPADRGDIVLGWLTRLTVVLALVGLVGFDLIALGAGRMQTEDHAQQAARAAVRTWSETHDVQRAYEAAVAEVARSGAPGDTIPAGGFSVTPEGVVTLTLQHTSPTLLVEKVGPARRWATTTATVTGRPAS